MGLEVYTVRPSRVVYSITKAVPFPHAPAHSLRLPEEVEGKVKLELERYTVLLLDEVQRATKPVLSPYAQVRSSKLSEEVEMKV